MPSTKNSDTSTEEIERLKRERDQLIHELWMLQRRPSAAIGAFLLLFGIVMIILSISFSSSIMIFVGMALIFWGVISLYLRPARGVHASSLDYTTTTLLGMADRLLRAFNFKGKGVYLPPLLLKDLKDGIVFVNNGSSINVPRPGELAEGKVLTKNPKGICLTAAGLGLTNLLEEKLGRSFSEVSLAYLMDKLPELFIDVLEIVEAFEIRSNQNFVYVKAKEAIFVDICRETRESLNICSSYGCPFCSSIAIALARCLGKPVFMERSEFSPRDKTLEVVYRVIKT